MSLLLIWIRHLLLLVPAVGTLLTGHVEAQGTYMLYILLALLILRASEWRSDLKSYMLLFELGWFGYIAYQEEGLLYLILFSSLIAVFDRLRDPRYISLYVLLGAILLNVCIQHREAELIWSINMVWFAVAAILYASSRTSGKQQYVESLYDKLASSHEELEQAKLRLQEYGSQIEQFAQAEERNRIAKDIHDDLGHRLIRQKMMMEAALQLLDQQPERARTMLTQIRDQMEDSMERMRSTLRRLSPADDKNARQYALDRLIAEAGQELGIEVSFSVQGYPQPLYPSTEYVLFRNAQEAITNVVRHGGAKKVDILLDYRPFELALTISNDGSVPTGTVTQGIGFRGMNERISMFGGRLEIRIDPHFAVTTLLPLKNKAVTPNQRPGVDNSVEEAVE